MDIADLACVGRGHVVSGSTIFWNAASLHFHLKERAALIDPIGKFMARWQRVLSAWPGLEGQVRRKPREPSAAVIHAHLISTRALLLLLVLLLRSTQTRAAAKVAVLEWVTASCARATEGHCARAAAVALDLAGAPMVTVSATGEVFGMGEVMSTAHGSVKRQWAALVQRLPRGVVTVVEVMRFVATVKLARLAGPCPAALPTKALLTQLTSAVVGFVTQNLEYFLLRIYAGNHELDTAPRVLRCRSTRRLSGGLDPDAAWAVLERTLEVGGLSPGNVLAVQNDQPHLRAVHKANAAHWATKELVMYADLNRQDFERVCKLSPGLGSKKRKE